MKYKKGQKLKYVGEDTWGNLHIGDIVTIMAVNKEIEEYKIWEKDKRDWWYCKEEWLEPIMPKKHSKTV